MFDVIAAAAAALGCSCAGVMKRCMTTSRGRSALVRGQLCSM